MLRSILIGRKVFALLALPMTLAANVSATVVGGGGSGTTDCLLALDAAVNIPASGPRNVQCVDGDPTCDVDGIINGMCDIRVGVCANSTYNPECSLSGVEMITVEYALDNGDPKFDPDFQALQTRIDSEIALPSTQSDACTVATAFLVPIKGPYRGRCGTGKKKVKLVTISSLINGRIYEDTDKMTLKCVPAPVGGCDPQVLFAGTFDRIQRQVFDQSCALSGCHDSQSMAGSLLLETGAALGNLVGVAPSNLAAAAAGWQRVTAGDSDASLLYHKVSGDLESGFGAQMPLDRRRLHSSLKDVIRLWIDAGAPPSGWVPGTDD